jgi:hypothetical protein
MFAVIWSGSPHSPFKAAPADRAAFAAIERLLMIAPCWAERDAAAAPVDEALAGAVPPGHAPHYLRYEEEFLAARATVTAAFAVAGPDVRLPGTSAACPPLTPMRLAAALEEA